jgi:ERCC4-related helicase
VAPVGICVADQVVCVVVDEAHRATGKYDIVTALNKVSTPASNVRDA